MILHDYSYRNRAALALHALVGGSGKQRIVMGVPVAIEMADIRLLIIAGDHERALAPFAIVPLARETGCEVLATWVDPMLSGHRFLIDALVKEQGVPRVFTERVLFRTRAGANFLVDPRGDGPAIAVDERGIRIAPRLPYRSTPERLLGIAAGQALLQQRIYAGTPYATPRERNFAR